MSEASTSSAIAVEVPRVKKPRFRTYWLTRSRLNGELSGKVDIWLSRPDRIRFDDGDVHWIALTPLSEDASEGGQSTHYGRWTIAEAHAQIGNGVPATDLECTRYGSEDNTVEAMVS